MMAKEVNLYRLHQQAEPPAPTPTPEKAPPVAVSQERPQVRARFVGTEDSGEAAYTLDMQRLGARIAEQRLQGGP
jgi:hypothetical protein